MIYGKVVELEDAMRSCRGTLDSAAAGTLKGLGRSGQRMQPAKLQVRVLPFPTFETEVKHDK